MKIELQFVYEALIADVYPKYDMSMFNRLCL